MNLSPDITGMDKFCGSYKWTDELARSVIRETGLPISFALSVNKTVSKIATGEGNRWETWKYQKTGCNS
jgi:DNA polymerase-4